MYGRRAKWGRGNRSLDTILILFSADDMRHIKKQHGENEDNHGQIDITIENISDIYDIVNDFDNAEKERTDNKGNQSIRVSKNNEGIGYALLVERGKTKAEIKTAYKKKKPQVSDVTSPEPNVRNDPASSFNENITQNEEKSNKVEGEKYKNAIIRPDGKGNYLIEFDDEIKTELKNNNEFAEKVKRTMYGEIIPRKDGIYFAMQKDQAKTFITRVDNIYTNKNKEPAKINIDNSVNKQKLYEKAKIDKYSALKTYIDNGLKYLNNNPMS